MLSKENDLGSIYLSKNVIGTIVINAADKVQGKAVLCSSKGKASKSEIRNMTFFDLRNDDDGLVIKIYMLMKFGAGVSNISSVIIDEVDREVTKVLGEKPKNISLVIKGVVSKNVAKTNIEVRSDEL